MHEFQNPIIAPVNPYDSLPNSSFWKSAVVQSDPTRLDSIYRPKFKITDKDKIATAGSCFAQHITRELRQRGCQIIDREKAPPGLTASLHSRFGYGLYSCRHGNIYTTRQLVQLATEVVEQQIKVDCVWVRDGAFFDAFRPSIEPSGWPTPEDVVSARAFHLKNVAKVLRRMDVFIFTLGLTEGWALTSNGQVYPTAPGTLCGTYDPGKYQFFNLDTRDIYDDIRRFIDIVTSFRGNNEFKLVLTVSPVPLTATASAHHVLYSTMLSKATLRSAAGMLVKDFDNVDYFPSFELVTNPSLRSSGYEDNLRSVRRDTVDFVMRHFFDAHILGERTDRSLSSLVEPEDVICDEALLEDFGGSK